MATYAACETERKRILGLGRKIQVRLVKNPLMGVDSQLATDRGGSATGTWPSDNVVPDNYMLQVKFPPGGYQMGVGALSIPSVTQMGGGQTTNSLYYRNATTGHPITHAESAAFRAFGGGLNGIASGSSHGSPSVVPGHNKGRLAGTRTGGWHMYHIDHAINIYESVSVISSTTYIATL